MEIRYPEIGVCGLSCRLCPSRFTEGESRCAGCKSTTRMAVGCPFIACAIKRKGIEFCWECGESGSCARWAGHRESGRVRDSFVCYAKLEENIAAIDRDGLQAFIDGQCEREDILRGMLAEFNEGRSKTFYCVAATLLDPDELRSALAKVRETAGGMEVREKAKALRALLEAAASARSIKLALRK